MSGSISPSLIVFLVVVGAGASVLLGYAVTHHYFRPGANDAGLNTSWPDAEGGSQEGYMRMVRDRERNELSKVYGWRGR